MAKSKKQRSRRPPPAKRLAPTFAVLKDAALAGDLILKTGHSASDPIASFDRAVLLRAVNLLKSCRVLLVESHWELAAGAARQLFEMLVNVEYLNALPDREEAIRRYAKYGLLQTLEGRIRREQYAIDTGRPADTESLLAWTRMRDSQFTEFHDKKGNFLKHWASRDTRALAEASANQPLRTSQYLQLFSVWSEQVHATPASLLPVLFPGTKELVTDFDDRSGSETGAMCVVLYADLCTHLMSLTKFDSVRVGGWAGKLMDQAASFGAEVPPTPKPTVAV